MENRFETFQQFYPFYLKEHRNKICRLLHVVGTTLVFVIALLAIFLSKPILWIWVPISGYGFTWAGHFFFEKNKPATFKYPLWSLRSDFKMYFEIVSGKRALDASKD